MSNEQDPSIPVPQERPGLNRRRFLGIVGGAIAGLSFTEPVLAEEPPSSLRTQQQLEALNEFNALLVEPIRYQAFKEENLSKVLPLVQAAQRLTIRMHQIRRRDSKLGSLNLDQVLTAKTFAQQEFIATVATITGKRQSTGNIDLDTERALIRDVLPQFAAHGLHAIIDLQQMPIINPVNGKEESAAVLFALKGVWKVEAATDQTLTNFWGEKDFHFQEIMPGASLRDSSGKTMFPIEDIGQCLPAEAETIHDTVVWRPGGINQEQVVLQIRGWQEKQERGFWEKVQRFSLARYDRARRDGRLDPDLIFDLTADQCRSTYVPDLLKKENPVETWTEVAKERTRKHEASHVYLSRLPNYKTGSPVLRLRSLDIEYQQKQVALTSIREELGALLGETLYGTSMATQIESLCLFSSHGKEGPNYAAASKWILQQIATILSNDPARFGITIDANLALTSHEQALLQATTWLKPEIAQELREAMEQLIPYYLATDIETLLDEKTTVPPVSNNKVPLGKIGVGIATLAGAALAAAKWRQNRMQALKEKERAHQNPKKKKRPQNST